MTFQGPLPFFAAISDTDVVPLKVMAWFPSHLAAYKMELHSPLDEWHAEQLTAVEEYLAAYIGEHLDPRESSAYLPGTDYLNGSPFAAWLSDVHGGFWNWGRSWVFDYNFQRAVRP